MTDAQLRKCIEKEAEDSKDANTTEGLHELVESKLKMNMHNWNARLRIQGLFVNYHSVLSQHGVEWIIVENQELAVTQVPSTIRP